jgi:outer membrane protein assembly factor BamB
MKFSLLLFFALLTVGSVSGQHWTQFRGQDQTGIIEGFKIPTEWNLEDNLKWTIPSPAMGWSSPIVWGDQIFITGSSLLTEEMEKRNRGGGEYRTPLGIHVKLEVICLDKETGAIKWRKTAYEGPSKVATHGGSPYSTETPVTDGVHVYAYFGTMGLHAFTLDGELVWQKDLGVFEMDGEWGTGTSPMIHEGVLFMQVDNLDFSSLIALEALTGKEKWKVNRDEGPNRGTPMIWRNRLRSELVTQGAIARSYNPENGELYWQINMEGGRSSSTAVGDQDRLIIANEKRGAGGFMFSIRAGASGDISLAEGQTSNDGVEWKNPNGGIAMSSPLIYEGCVYAFERRTGMVSCYDAKTGDVNYYRKHLKKAREFWSTPWAYEGHIYCIDGNGITHVLESGPILNEVRLNELDDKIWAMPAFTPGSLILRGAENLYSIESKDSDSLLSN